MINQLVNQRYEVLERIGESALFAVYKARDRVSNRMVALKVVQTPYATDPAFLKGLQEGMTAASALNHPNVTHFHEFGQEDDSLYAVVEFVRGINLKERIRRIAPFTLSVAVDFACAIGEGLHYAHRVGQAHGDLRPHNIIISPEGTVKITDFGIQRGIANSAAAQREVLLRSAPYHAPELSTTKPGTVSGDIYALGAILYEMLTGTPLYGDDSPEKIADQHAFGPIPSPRLINPGVPRSVEGIVLKCLQKHPEDRYQSAAELLNDLKAVRDALRFGKPLSWSPIDIEKAGGAAAAAPKRIADPVAEVTASSQAPAMPSANNRLRVENERVSIYIRAAIVTMTVIILVTLVGFVGVWSTMWVAPKPVAIPQMIGKPIEQARQMAETMKVRLIEHAEYSDKPRNIVYKTDPKSGAQTRPNHVINVWYSRGPEYVNVPNVANLPREEAEKRLQEAGLKLGNVTLAYSPTVNMGHVISQNVSYKKRVFHDTPVGLVISEGPTPDYASPNDTPAGSTTEEQNTNPDTSNETTDPPAEIVEESHQFERDISIPRDGKGVRQVRIEYTDTLKSPISVIDEPHDEGDRIPVSFPYYGKTIRLVIYYDSKVVFDRTFDPQATRRERIQGGGVR